MTEAGSHSARDFLQPRLAALYKQGVEAGFPRDEILAVLIDLLDDSDLEDVEQR